MVGGLDRGGRGRSAGVDGTRSRPSSGGRVENMGRSQTTATTPTIVLARCDDPGIRHTMTLDEVGIRFGRPYDVGWLEAEAAEARRARHHHHRARYNGRDVLAVGPYNRRLTSRSKAHREWADVEWRLKWLELLFERRHGLEWWTTTTAGARFVALLTDQSTRSMHGGADLVG